MPKRSQGSLSKVNVRIVLPCCDAFLAMHPPLLVTLDLLDPL